MCTPHFTCVYCAFKMQTHYTLYLVYTYTKGDGMPLTAKRYSYFNKIKPKYMVAGLNFNGCLPSNALMTNIIVTRSVHTKEYVCGIYMHHR